MDKVVGVGRLASFIHVRNNLVLRYPLKVKSVENVITNGAREKHRLLLDNCHLLVVPSRIDIPNVYTIEKHLAFGRVVEALTHSDDG